MTSATFTPVMSRLRALGRWPDDVDVWRVSIPEEITDWPLVEGHLSEEERFRAARYLRDKDRLRFAVTRAALRALLVERTGVPAEVLGFNLGPNGKPALDDYPQIRFNVTHSGQHALIAMSDLRQVGIDVQIVDPTFRWRELLALVCTANEQQMIISSPEDSQSQMFFRCWTGKEAILKARGIGITEGLPRVSLDLLSPGGQRLGDPTSDEGSVTTFFQLHWLTEIAGYAACIAFET